MDLYGFQASLPSCCPYSITLLFSNSYSSTYLIREKDNFGEYPNIYAKVYNQNANRQPVVIILSDSGTGLDIANDQSEIVTNGSEDAKAPNAQPSRWNISTFLSMTINPSDTAPYFVLTTHCHYDHIGGICHLIEANPKTTVLASSHDVSYVTPWKALQKHSLCELKGLKAPHYDAHWIEDAQRLSYIGIDSPLRKEFSITIFHTPGHTPDSLSWYDRDSCTLCVGDMFYERESDETRSGSGGRWAREPQQPVVFTRDSNVIDWNASMHRLLDFVRTENRRLDSSKTAALDSTGYRQNGQGAPVDYAEAFHEDWSVIQRMPTRTRVVLCAAHVTIAADAEFALLDMLAFMLRIQLDQVPKHRVQDVEGNENVWLWDDDLSGKSRQSTTETTQNCRFSVRAPWTIIHKDFHQNTSKPYVSIESARNTDFRSMLKQMTTPSLKSNVNTHLKSNALSSVSHSSVMADLPASSTRSRARNG